MHFDNLQQNSMALLFSKFFPPCLFRRFESWLWGRVFKSNIGHSQLANMEQNCWIIKLLFCGFQFTVRSLFVLQIPPKIWELSRQDGSHIYQLQLPPHKFWLVANICQDWILLQSIFGCRHIDRLFLSQTQLRKIQHNLFSGKISQNIEMLTWNVLSTENKLASLGATLVRN